MLFAPVQLQPDNVSFDATKIYKFTWKNDSDPQTAFTLKIYNNTTNAQVYTSNKITSSVSEHTLPANTLTNNVEFKYQLEIFSGTPSVLSEFVFFKTNTTPVITMTVTSSITTTWQTFTASYSQAQSIPYHKFKFILYNSADEILVSSDWQYGYNLTYTFDGFINNTTYKVECITESQYNLQGTSGKKSFTVAYVSADALNILQATPDNENGSMSLSWSAINETYADVVGSYSYVTGKFGQGIQVDANSKIVYEKNIPEDFTINFWCKLASNFTGTVLTLGNDDFVLGYNGTRFYVNSIGLILYSLPVTIPANFFKIGIISSNKIIIKTDTQTVYIGSD